MTTGAEDMLAQCNSIDEGLERLRRDLWEGTDVADEGDGAGADEDERTDEPPLDFAIFEFELERMRKRLHIWDIFVRHMRDGARTWSEVRGAVTRQDLDEIVTICDGTPLRDVLLGLG